MVVKTPLTASYSFSNFTSLRHKSPWNSINFLPSLRIVFPFLKLVTAHWHRLIGTKLILIVIGWWRHTGVFLFAAKVLFDNEERFLVDFLDFMRLKEFDFVEAWWKKRTEKKWLVINNKWEQFALFVIRQGWAGIVSHLFIAKFVQTFNNIQSDRRKS